MLLEMEAIRYSRGRGDQQFTLVLPQLQIQSGELIALTGRSGSGKSTLLEMLGLLVAPHDSGRFFWHGAGTPIDIAASWRRGDHAGLARLRGVSMGFVLQSAGLLPFLTIAGNLALVRRALGLPARDADLEAMIERLGIARLLSKKPRQLSLGEQQRASIVRALAHRPALVLADEPTSALDPGLGDEVMALLLEQAATHGSAVVIATHEIDRVAELGLRRVRGTNLHPSAGFAWQFTG